MLKVRNLDFSYVKDNPVLRKIAFETQSGECTAILGNNGAGKTTLLKCLNRILTPQKGSVYINFSSFQTNLLSLPQKKIARAVSYLAQEAPSGDMTVYDTVMLGRLPYLKWGVTSKDIEIVNSAIEQLGLTTFSQRPAHTLSGGERQKVALARALAQRAKILLLDEPTSSLDLKNQHEVLGLVQDICKKNEMSAVMVIHDLNLALRFCDRYILMKDNRVLATGGEEVITSENISKVYQMPVSIHEIDNMKLVIPKSE